METKKEGMTLKVHKGIQQARILLEGDMIVPDTKPDVAQVLRCSGRVRLDESKVAEEKLQLMGTLIVDVLYRAIGGQKPLYAMTMTLPIQETLYVEGLEAGDETNIRMELEHMECSLINDRKIGLHAVVKAEVDTAGSQQYDMVTGVEDGAVALLRQNIQTIQPVTEKKDRFTVKESIPLSTEQPEIDEILDTHIGIANTDIRAMEGKTAIRGNLELQVLYTAAQTGMPAVWTQTIPFHGFIESSGMTPQTMTQVHLNIQEEEIRPDVDEDGESRVFDVTVTIGAELSASNPVEIALVTDAYGLEQNLTAQQEQISYPVPVGTAQNHFTIREIMTLEQGEEPMLQAVTAWGTLRIENVHTETDLVIVEGVLEAEVLYLCQQDAQPVCVLHRGFPFQRNIEVKGAVAEDSAQVEGNIEELDFRLMTEQEGEIRAQIVLDVVVNGEGSATLVTELQEQQDSTECKMPGAVIYIVQPGDSLWSIAKKYRTTIDRILMVNELENPQQIYPGQKLLILRQSVV